jgi:ABC-type phosphate/phosphonate transport system substrate-binding protein
MRPILVGAVIYDPKVSVIWDIIRSFFAAEQCPIDTVFYTNYELQVEALLSGHIDIAWNSPLAWVDAQRRSGGRCSALAMRDTDRDRVSRLLVRSDAGIARLADLRGRTVATGASDSPQSTLLPLHLLHGAGLLPKRDFNHRRFDLLVGKHGDHVGGELEALRALQRGEADAAAVLDLNWDAWQADGTASPGQLRVLATTRAFDHCNFTALDAFTAARATDWVRVLFRMRYGEPAHREMMDLEGLKAWLPGRTSGYADLEAAVDEQRYLLGAGT